jgi:cell division protein FtsB
MTTARESRGNGDDGLRRKAWAVASLLALVALVVGSLFGDRGILQLLMQRKRAELLQHELQDLRAENRRLATEIESLRSDPRAIERIAREQLGLARPGETVFILREEQGPARP